MPANSAAKMQQAVVERTAAVQQITRLKTWVDQRLQEASRYEVERRLELLEAAFKNYQRSQGIVEQYDVNELENNERGEVEDMYFEASSLMEVKLAVVKSTEDPHPQSQVQISQVKLPKIQPPTFDGDYSNWLTFYSKFKALVHDKPYDTIYKFETLRNCLVGKAADQLKDLEMTESNYDEALRMVYLRWNNPKLIAHAHMRKIFDAPPIKVASCESLTSLINTVQSNLRALKTLGLPVSTWDDLIVYILLTKLDSRTKSKWDETAPISELPNLTSLYEFLEKRAQSLATDLKEPLVAKSKSGEATFGKQSLNRRGESHIASDATNRRSCDSCSGKGHSLANCRKFKKMLVKDRRQLVKRKDLCFNCLVSGHRSGECTATRCSACCQPHHDLLHLPVSDPAIKTQSTETPSTSKMSNMAKKCLKSYCLLSTAIVNVQDKHGNFIQARAFIDSGSQWNFVSEDLVQKLGVKKTRVNCHVGTIGGGTERSQHLVTLNMKSSHSSFERSFEAAVMKNITDEMPDHLIDTSSWKIPPNLMLADPKFAEPARIDILLGKSIEIEIRRPERIQLSNEGPILDNTELGWIAGGDIKEPAVCPSISKLTGCALKNDEAEFDMSKFWRIEEPDCDAQTFTAEDKMCEEKFKQSVTKRNTGHYQVALPFRSNVQSLGNSKEMATRRLLSLLKRLERQPEVHKMYAEFLKEYESLGHMKEVHPTEVQRIKNYIPHQYVLRPSSSTTKLRVVFDASAKTSTSVSLNDVLMVGPVVQSDLFSILCRFRTFEIVFSADVEKMYRQIYVDDDDSFYQCILWKPPESQTIKTYRLTTVTYGTSCAPYLATRSLSHLAFENSSAYPLAASVINENVYVDDILTGANSLEEAFEKKDQLVKLFKSCHMTLRKWSASDSRLLCEIPKTDQESYVNIGDKTFVKTLGMAFVPNYDCFTYSMEVDINKAITKRSITSDIARIYDPLGLVSPIITTAKIILQKLWLLKLNWDDEPTDELKNVWNTVRNELHLINKFRIPRKITMKPNPSSVQIHGFSDASEMAYGACVYLRSVDENGIAKVSLICAKSKVAPLKVVSLPRLELCGFELLCRLVKKLTVVLNLPIEKIYLWCDSTIVLSWITNQSNQFKTFVANRVSKIHEITRTELYSWRFVPGAENPADIVSRGTSPSKLLEEQYTKWYQGPQFLLHPNDKWPKFPKGLNVDPIPELKKKKFALVSIQLTDLTEKISEKFRHSFKSLIRIFGYVQAFVNKCRKKVKIASAADQQNDALKMMIKSIQHKYFTKELEKLSKHQPISSKSKLKPLAPFVGEDNLLRVGGRLKHSQGTPDTKHQILLPANHYVTRTIFRHYHYNHLHCGPQTLLAAVREMFWVVGGRDIARKIVRNCTICYLVHPRPIYPLMGQIPAPRVTPGPPFYSTCVDYVCGLTVHQKGRGSRTYKVYVCVFVCMKTKAIHLEVVGDLSTPAFLAALKRMVSRRGLCKELFCDNGTNFVGAKNELQVYKSLIESQEHQDNVRHFCLDNSIEVKFCPPKGPHFNGLAEAGVKSFKHHLYRIASQAHLTFEELNTLVIQIEAVLNSRPLTELSTDPNDLEPLTPGHFLIGRPLTSFPEPQDDEKYSRLHQYRRIRSLSQQFWKRWRHEYLNSLQQRQKWQTNSKSTLRQGQLVILRQDDVPPLFWPTGRIVELKPGQDGITRVVKIKTATGTYDRPVVKICPLPYEDCEN